MAARITALLADLETALAAIYPEITFGLGQKALARQNSPPRIVWIPTVAKHDPPEKRQTNPRSLRTRAVTIVAHCWAFDPDDPADDKKHLDACEELVLNLLVRLHKTAWGSLELEGEEWLQPDEIAHGHAALVKFTVRSPVEAKTYQTVQPTTLEPYIVGSVAGDSNVDWGET